MLILILIDVQYSQKAAFSFEKDLNGQSHSSSGFHHPVKKFLPAKFPIPPTGGNSPLSFPLSVAWRNPIEANGMSTFWPTTADA